MALERLVVPDGLPHAVELLPVVEHVIDHDPARRVERGDQREEIGMGKGHDRDPLPVTRERPYEPLGMGEHEVDRDLHDSGIDPVLHGPFVGPPAPVAERHRQAAPGELESELRRPLSLAFEEPDGGEDGHGGKVCRSGLLLDRVELRPRIVRDGVVVPAAFERLRCRGGRSRSPQPAIEPPAPGVRRGESAHQLPEESEQPVAGRGFDLRQPPQSGIALAERQIPLLPEPLPHQITGSGLSVRRRGRGRLGGHLEIIAETVQIEPATRCDRR